MANIPRDLSEEIRRLEGLFTVDVPKLKAITKHFASELTKGELSSLAAIIMYFKSHSGLSVEGGNIVRERLTPRLEP